MARVVSNIILDIYAGDEVSRELKQLGVAT